MTIKNVHYSYFTKKYNFGPCLDSLQSLEVVSTSYNDVVEAIKNCVPDGTNFTVLKFTNVK